MAEDKANEEQPKKKGKFLKIVIYKVKLYLSLVFVSCVFLLTACSPGSKFGSSKTTVEEISQLYATQAGLPCDPDWKKNVKKMEFLQKMYDTVNEGVGSIDNNLVCFNNLQIYKFDKPFNNLKDVEEFKKQNPQRYNALTMLKSQTIFTGYFVFPIFSGGEKELSALKQIDSQTPFFNSSDLSEKNRAEVKSRKTEDTVSKSTGEDASVPEPIKLKKEKVESKNGLIKEVSGNYSRGTGFTIDKTIAGAELHFEQLEGVYGDFWYGVVDKKNKNRLFVWAEGKSSYGTNYLKNKGFSENKWLNDGSNFIFEVNCQKNSVKAKYNKNNLSEFVYKQGIPKKAMENALGYSCSL